MRLERDKLAAEGGENEAIALRLLLEAILLKHGYDFRDYSRASLRRRIHKRMTESGLDNISQMIHLVLTDLDFFDGLLADLSINVTEMFRDPLFYRALREQVLPELSSRPHLKFWHAGCATGEEVYSVAILLHEMGLLPRVRLYATDINEAVVTRAREGVFSLARIREGIENYQQSGGRGSFSDHYTARYESAVMNTTLREAIVFAVHNLATEATIGEMDVIVCRNVLIYFNRSLQERVIRMFADSLVDGGVLCLGNRESVRFTDAAEVFEELDAKQRIYRRRARPRASEGGSANPKAEGEQVRS